MTRLSIMALAAAGLVLPAHAQESGMLVVNEIQVANIDQYVDPSWNYGGWVELYNPSSKPFRLRDCWVSDDPNNLKKVRITHPIAVYGRSYKNIWFGHSDKYCPTQIGMDLDTEGGVFCLSDSEGNLIVKQSYPAAVPRASWARLEDITGEWGYTCKPTPEHANGHPVCCQERLPAPEPDVPSCTFTQPFDLHIPTPEGVTLRYTTDGSAPTSTNGRRCPDGTLHISGNSTLRMAFFRSDALSSPVVTRSYLLRDKDFCLPILSIVSAPANLYSDELGIFVKGINGRPGLGQTDKCNWNMDWDRPVNVDYMDASGKSLVNQEAEIRRSGGWGRMQEPYSFKIHSARQYEGKGTMDYPFFPDKPYCKTKMLLVRNGGNCDYYYRMRDAFLQKLVLSSGIDIDAQDYQPVVHYINGEYKGTLNLREPNNKHYIYANFGLDEEDIDFFAIDNDSGYVQKCGTHDALQQWYDLSKNARDEAVYDTICHMVDMDEYCYYMAVKLYLGDGDWPDNNMKAWRPREENGRWRFILYDLDSSFASDSPFTHFASMRVHTFNTLLGEPVSNYTMEIEPVTIFLNMLDNDVFRRHFIDTFCILAGSVLEPSRCKPLVQEWARRVYPMQILSTGGYGHNSNIWEGANDLTRRISQQPAAMLRALESYAPMKINAASAQRLSLKSNVSEARLLLNGHLIPTGEFHGRIYQAARLRAEAPGGYVFKGWRLLSGNVSADMTVAGHGQVQASHTRESQAGLLDGEEQQAYLSTSPELELPAGDLELEACFGKAGTTDTQVDRKTVCINEVSAANSIYVSEYYKKGDWVELYNLTGEEIDLSGMYLSDDLRNPHKYRITAQASQASTLVPAHGHTIIWCDKRDPVSQLHAPFKLENRDNACVLLTAADDSWADTLSYCAHSGRESVGRFPDGGLLAYRHSRPTIGKPNGINLLSMPCPQVHPGGEETPDGIPQQIACDGDMSLRYQHDGTLAIKAAPGTRVQLHIYSQEGLLERSETLYLPDGITHASLPALPRNTHIAVILGQDGQKCSLKFHN